MKMKEIQLRKLFFMEIMPIFGVQKMDMNL